MPYDYGQHHYRQHNATRTSVVTALDEPGGGDKRSNPAWLHWCAFIFGVIAIYIAMTSITMDGVYLFGEQTDLRKLFAPIFGLYTTLVMDGLILLCVAISLMCALKVIKTKALLRPLTFIGVVLSVIALIMGAANGVRQITALGHLHSNNAASSGDGVRPNSDYCAYERKDDHSGGAERHIKMTVTSSVSAQAGYRMMCGADQADGTVKAGEAWVHEAMIKGDQSFFVNVYADGKYSDDPQAKQKAAKAHMTCEVLIDGKLVLHKESSAGDGAVDCSVDALKYQELEGRR